MSDSFSIISDLRGELSTANAEIARLKAMLAEQWQPVESMQSSDCICKEYACDLRIFIKDDGQIVLKGTGVSLSFDLGDRRICYKVSATEAKDAPVLDWEKARNHLDKVFTRRNNLEGMDRINSCIYLQNYLIPSLLRYELGERTSELYEAMMGTE